jgi:hypothetical protein
MTDGVPNLATPVLARWPIALVAGEVGVRDFGYEPGNALRYGAVGDGATDNAAAFANWITSCRALKIAAFLPGTATNQYNHSTTLILGSDVLAFVALRGDHSVPVLNFTGATGFNVNCSGTSTSAFCNATSISNVHLRNALATINDGCLKTYFTVTLRLDNVKLTTNGIAHDRNECISFLGVNVYVSSTGGANMLYGSRGLARNYVMIGGRTYGCQVATHGVGESILYVGHNIEFCDVVCLTAAFDTIKFVECHIEELNCLVTNAVTVPFGAAATPWVDNGSLGVGSSGAIEFDNCVGLGSTNYTNAIVIKNQASFTYELIIRQGYWQNTNLLVRGSFTPNAATAIPSGSDIQLIGRITTTFDVLAPADAFTRVLKWSGAGYSFVAGINGEIGRFESAFDNAGLHVSCTAANGKDYALQATGGASGYGVGKLVVTSGAGAGTAQHFATDLSVTANETRFLLWDVNSGTMKRVLVGAADSGGVGFRMLRILN